MILSTDMDIFQSALVLFLLYAEIHYAFKFFPSRLKKCEPEVIADVPHRLEPGQPLPVLILVKDADRFPITLDKVIVRSLKAEAPRTLLIHNFDTLINQKSWWKILDVSLPPEIYGDVLIDVEFTLTREGESRVYHNDNYRISSHRPFKVHVAQEPVPRLPNWLFGDLHYHSSYTSDQVEFGAPLWPTIRMAKAIGLNFFAVTDHSYDLDDQVENYLKSDPEHPKWQTMWREVEEIERAENEFIVIPGEEVSVGNANNRNVHLLVLNDQTFYPGSGDSAERWFSTRPDLPATEVMDRMNSKNYSSSGSKTSALAFAAHPEIRPPFLEWLLVRRGSWHHSDYCHPNLTGMQIYNGIKDKYFLRGVDKWVELLLEGKRLTITAGNDAHGNFARFRQIGFPFLTMHEHENQIFGKGRTGVLVKGKLSKQAILNALRDGRSIITDGPFAIIQAQTANDEYELGDTVTSNQLQLRLYAQTTPEFGDFDSIELYCGDFSQKRQVCQYKLTPQSGQRIFEKIVFMQSLPKRGYLRLIAKTRQQSQEHWCLTNPIWINQGTIKGR